MDFFIVLVAISGCLWFQYGHFLGSVTQRFFNSHFNKNPLGSNLSKRRLQALSVGLIMAEQHFFYYDSLDVAVKHIEIARKVLHNWGLDSQDKVHNKLNHFFNYGSSLLNDQLISIYCLYPQEIWRDVIIDELVGRDDKYNTVTDYYLCQINQMAEVRELLLDKGIISEHEVDEVLLRGTIGWDIARTVYLARMGYAVGYLSSCQAWQAIDDSFNIIRQHFDDWQQFAKSYILGWALWTNNGGVSGSNLVIYRECISNPDSPWLKYALHD